MAQSARRLARSWSLISGGSLICSAGLNLGIEFEGGTSWEVLAPDVSVSDARDALSGTDAAAAKIQTVGGDSIRVRSDLSKAPMRLVEITVDSGRARLASRRTTVSLSRQSARRGVIRSPTRPDQGAHLLLRGRRRLHRDPLEWKMAVGAS